MCEDYLAAVAGSTFTPNRIRDLQKSPGRVSVDLTYQNSADLHIRSFASMGQYHVVRTL
jgi:hypothetical protein